MSDTLFKEIKINSDADLPTKLGDYFLWIDNEYKHLGAFADNKFWSNGNEIKNVTHWLKPLSEDKTFPYLKSEQEFQIIAMRALGINYPENGGTFEQCVNAVLMMAKPKEFIAGQVMQIESLLELNRKIKENTIDKVVEWCDEQEEFFDDKFPYQQMKQYLISLK